MIEHVVASDPKQWVLVILFPVFLAIAAAEAIRVRGTGIYKWQDSAASAVLGGAYLISEVLLYPLFVWAIFDRVRELSPFRVEISITSFVLLYIAVDFLFYTYHRTSHRVRLFWATHCVHHASERMNFTTAMRQSALYPLALAWLFFLPLAYAGFDREWIFFALALNLGYQFFLHTQCIGRLPAPIEWLFNTPSHHRVHHGRNARYIDRNFGGTFIVFDRLFDTFTPEADNEKPEYGITRQVHSYNPVYLTLHEWIDLLRDVARPGPLATRLKHLWAPPEWQR